MAQEAAARPDWTMIWNTTPSTLECPWMPNGKWITWHPDRRWHRPRPTQSTVLPDADPNQHHAHHRRQLLRPYPNPIVIVAARTQESPMRRMRLQKSMNRPPWTFAAGHCWPLYDWTTAGPWRRAVDRTVTATGS